MHKHTEQYTVRSFDTDESGIARASSLLRYMQEAALYQMTNRGPSNDELRRSGRMFMLSRMALSSYAPLYAGNQIDVETWPSDSAGISFCRCFRIWRDGIITAEASSVWMLLDLESYRVIRVRDADFDYGCAPPLEVDVPKRAGISTEMRLSLVGERAVEYADIDQNRHVNNTNYADILCHCIPGVKSGTHRVVPLYINYIAEAKKDDVLKIYRGEENGIFYMRTVKSDGKTNTEAKIVIEAI